MKLHALDRKRFVAQSHDLPFARPRTHFERVGQTRAFDEQRMVTGRGERVIEASENRFSVMLDGRSFSVHQSFGSHDVSTESLADRLLSETHSENRDLARETLDGGETLAGLIRRARPR